MPISLPDIALSLSVKTSHRKRFGCNFISPADFAAKDGSRQKKDLFELNEALSSADRSVLYVRDWHL
jgi:hypothetical protein